MQFDYMQIYLDTCCYSRPYDGQDHTEQLRVRQEIKAIMDTVQMCGTSGIPIIGSPAVIAEIDDIGKPYKREQVYAFYERVVNAELTENANITARMLELKAQGFKGFDAYHLAFAESAGVNFLLTTDDRFERKAKQTELKTKVINPINFLGEYLIWRLLLT